MKTFFIIIACLLVTSCTNQEKETPASIVQAPDCEQKEALFLKDAESMTASLGDNLWISDMDVFYSPKLQTCVGNYIASRREGGESDTVLFVIQGMEKHEMIFVQTYTGKELKNEYEGQKNYRRQIASLQGI